MRTPPAHTAVRRRLIAVLLVTGVLAIIGGLALAVEPDGHLLRLSTDPLFGTPFKSYRVPGLVLAIVVGGTQLFAGLAVMRHEPRSLRLAMAAALTLAGWVAIQVVVLGTFMWLQPVCFLVAFVEVLLVAANLPRKPSHKQRGRRR